MKTPALFLLLVTLLFGCSKEQLEGKFDIYRAEDLFFKADYTLKNQKVSFEKRRTYYEEACRYFARAYEVDPKLFTLSRIESAAESCLAVEDFVNVEKFNAFYDQYVREHPMEFEYGGEIAAMPLEA